MDEEDSLSPHLLLPDSISQLEEFGRQKKWHKKQHKHHRQRQFNDLWVRIEDRKRAEMCICDQTLYGDHFWEETSRVADHTGNKVLPVQKSGLLCMASIMFQQ
ncbi:hypothetical protein DUI87_14900 [Hirundo rustica rustica]|uniref:Metalloprotease TIKI n=1 Tax=Hirundo rustica rustica TaxID=333673 RepID=A0A3M0K655_HIRRU|nr:hypothetical protein DUI87_14900 [Hirundo rustica rustica]